VSQSKVQNSETKIFLGVDGGQSHTEAIIADEYGRILGRGTGGASNHAEIPGGRERLQKAITESADEALEKARLPSIDEIIFASAHFGMTGGAIYKEEIISQIIKARRLTVGHDAPTALFGATAGKAGVVVIAGTGSVVFGINEAGETAGAGGLGYLFSDEGSGFWLAAQIIRLAIKERDNLIATSGLLKIVLDFFGRHEIRELTDDFYNAKVSRKEIASLAKRAHQAAVEGNEIIRQQIMFGASTLAESVRRVAEKLKFQVNFPVAGVGGMFQAELMNKYFDYALAEKVSRAEFIKPRFGPAIGALLMAYRQAEVEISKDLLSNLEKVSSE
jgi:N-acetylglucosamine kinase-like BadF-type ATPase